MIASLGGEAGDLNDIRIVSPCHITPDRTSDYAKQRPRAGRTAAGAGRPARDCGATVLATLHHLGDHSPTAPTPLATTDRAPKGNVSTACCTTAITILRSSSCREVDGLVTLL
ncbi:unnamed protein product [Spodoptera exigua]|nr:unnamed protein product [Spodoptera exigua]